MNKQKVYNLGKTFSKNIVYPLLYRKNVPLWVHLWVTKRCNLRCKYCYVANTKNDCHELNTEDMKRAVFHVKHELDCSMIALMGGEPLLRKDLPDLVQYMSDLDIYSYLTTNGTLLNDNLIHKLCESELNLLEVSLDGIKPNDISKKTGDRLMPVIDKLIDFSNTYDTEISVNMVITKQNYNELDELLRKLAGKRVSITTGLYIPDISSRKNICDDPLAFSTPEDLDKLEKLSNKLIRLKKMGAFLIMSDSYYEKWVPFMKNIIQLNKLSLLSKNNSYKMKPLWTCKAGKDFIEIDCDGRIRFCSYLNDLIHPDLTIFDLKKDYYQKLRYYYEKRLETCNPLCLANCFYQVAEIKKHTLKFVKEAGFRHMMHHLEGTFDPSIDIRRYENKIKYREMFQKI